MLVMFLFLFSAPQTDRYYKNNTDNKMQNCLKNYARLCNPFNFPWRRQYRIDYCLSSSFL